MSAQSPWTLIFVSTQSAPNALPTPLLVYIQTVTVEELYRPTISCSISGAFGRILGQISMEKILLALLNRDDSELIMAAIMTATIKPRRPQDEKKRINTEIHSLGAVTNTQRGRICQSTFFAHANFRILHKDRSVVFVH